MLVVSKGPGDANDALLVGFLRPARVNPSNCQLMLMMLALSGS